MVDTSKATEAIMLTEKENRLLFEETIKWLATLKLMKTEGKLSEGRQKYS